MQQFLVRVDETSGTGCRNGALLMEWNHLQAGLSTLHRRTQWPHMEEASGRRTQRLVLPASPTLSVSHID